MENSGSVSQSQLRQGKIMPKSEDVLNQQALKRQGRKKETNTKVKSASQMLDSFPNDMIVFVHIPKTGGTSLRLALGKKLKVAYDYGLNSKTTSNFIIWHKVFIIRPRTIKRYIDLSIDLVIVAARAEELSQ